MQEIIKTREQLKEWLRYELRRYPVGGVYKFLCITELSILRKHQVLLRKSEYYINSGKKILGLLYKVRLLRIQNKYSIHIPLNTCGRGLYLIHVGPRLITGGAIIGKDCAMHINTGVVSGGTRNGTPILGNNIIIGFGAVVLGDTHIADGVAIGANAVVNKNVNEKNIAVAGVPAKKISNNGRMEWNKENRLKNDTDSTIEDNYDRIN